MDYIRVGDLCTDSNGMLSLEPDEIIDYVDISSVDNSTKRITGFATYKFADAPSRARKAAKKNDIIVSTVRPNLNAVAVCDIDVPHKLVVSTGFCVLSCKPEVNHVYLFHFCRSERFVETLVKQATGASYPAVNDRIIRDVMLPYHTPSEQMQIVSRLDSLQRIITARKRQLLELDTLIKARFVEMFGDPISNSKELPIHKLGEICELQAGDFTSADAIHEIADENNPYPCYGGNGIRGYVDNYTQEGIFPIIGRQGALCGNVQLASGKFRNTEHAVLVTPKTRLNRLWLLELLQLEDLYRFHTGAAQPGLAVKTLNQIAVPVASEEDQNKYADFYSQINKSKSAVQQALNESQLLFDSLMQKYFG